MPLQRRTFLASCGVALSGTLAGCVGAVTGDEPVEFAATEATVSTAALQDAGYEKRTIDDFVVAREVETAGITREVEVTNWRAEYERSLPLGPLGEPPAAVVVALSTPQVDVLGRSFNPVAEMSSDDLVEEVQGRYEAVQNAERVDTATLSILDADVAVTRYEAEAKLLPLDATIDVYLHVSEPIDHGDDFVVCVGAYPQLIPGEGGTVNDLFRAVTHE